METTNSGCRPKEDLSSTVAASASHILSSSVANWLALLISRQVPRSALREWEHADVGPRLHLRAGLRVAGVSARPGARRELRCMACFSSEDEKDAELSKDTLRPVTCMHTMGCIRACEMRYRC